MGKKLYVGNIPFTVREDNLSEHFSKCGTVDSVKIIIDRNTNRSKGFGFVEMATDEEAAQAIAELDGTEIDGRQLRVSEARPQDTNRERGGFGGRGGRGGDRGGDRGGRGGDRGNFNRSRDDRDRDDY